MKKKILLIGGGGYLGNELASSLKNEFAVTVCQRSNYTKKGIKFFKLNATKFQDCELKIKNFDIVINLAAVLGNKNPYKNFQINLSIFLNTYLATIKNNIKNYFFISSNSIYEFNRFKKSKKSNIYSYNFYKLVCELIGLKLSKKTKTNFKVIRVSNVYGPGMYEGFIFDLIKKILSKKKIQLNINKKSSRNFTYVTDTANCIKFLIKKKNWNSINITNSKRITFYDVVRKMSIYCKHNIEINNVGFENIRLFNTSKLKSLGWKDKMDFDRGIKMTLKKFHAI